VRQRSPRLSTGERPLASTRAEDGSTVAGTRDALHLGDLQIPWEQIEKADWDADTTTLTVTEVGTWGEPRRIHRLVVTDPGRVLELVRERVTASVVLQRFVAVQGRRGLFVIARRAPRGDQPVQWVYEFQEGVDPDDPAVRHAAEAALEQARQDVGLP
jgi:hypothetical protein